MAAGHEMLEHFMTSLKSASRLSNSVARETKLKTVKT
jgi:hypothetical protein